MAQSALSFLFFWIPYRIVYCYLSLLFLPELQDVRFTFNIFDDAFWGPKTTLFGVEVTRDTLAKNQPILAKNRQSFLRSFSAPPTPSSEPWCPTWTACHIGEDLSHGFVYPQIFWSKCVDFRLQKLPFSSLFIECHIFEHSKDQKTPPKSK